MSISKQTFGTTSHGQPVTCWRLSNDAGAAVEVLDLGAATRSVEIPDRSNVLRQVCMGFDTVREYEESTAYSGAIIGRHAGRIGKGAFTLNGKEFSLAVNDGPNHLHGGSIGFSHRLWSVEAEENRLTLSYTSPDGEEGYPGTLTLTATYQWSGARTLTLTLDAHSDMDTVASFTHHGYWSLSPQEPLGEQYYQVHAPNVVMADKHMLATGELLAVDGTPFDFRTPQRLGRVWSEKHPQLVPNCGLDHTFPVPGHGMRELGSLSSRDLKLTVSSTLPTLHIYTGAFTHAALEAQFIPDAVHHSNFPSTVLPAGQRWHHVIEYKFTT